VNKPPASIYEY